MRLMVAKLLHAVVKFHDALSIRGVQCYNKEYLLSNPSNYVSLFFDQLQCHYPCAMLKGNDLSKVQDDASHWSV